MARIQAWLHEIAEKYVQEIVAGVTGRVTYADAWLEPDAIIVPTKDISSTLEGWAAWKLPVVVNTKKQTYKYGTPVETVIGEPSVYAFTQWAKTQSVKKLRELLASCGIKATGDLYLILSYRLAYEYEKRSLTRQNLYVKSDIREQHIKALDSLLNTEGRGKHPDELAIVLIKHALRTGRPIKPLTTIGANDMAVEESPAEIRRRLLKEKEKQEKDTPKAEKDEGEEKGGKGKKGKAEKESDAIKKGKTAKAPEATAETESNDTDKETEDMKKKGAAKGKTAKAEKAPKAAKSGKGGLTDAKKEIPIGSIVKYIGDRNPKLKGKTGEVLRYSGPNGVAIKYKDGLVGTASPTALEMVTKGKSK
jgi:hypothetical protein